MNPVEKEAIAHTGVLGMKLGIRHYYAANVLKNAKKRNIDSWGKDRTHNILYISGISGSGKSTLAKTYSKANIIHLDSYFEHNNQKVKKDKNLEFNHFLKANDFDPDALNSKHLFQTDKHQYFKLVDSFSKLSEKFGENQYGKSKKVVMEGVELNDETMYPNKKFFDDKPTIETILDSKLSKKRASERDLQHSILEKPPLNELMHYGMPKRSGRYPYGSGKDKNQHSGDLLSRIDALKAKGLSETEIAKSMGLSTTQYRIQRSLARDAQRAPLVARAQGLRAKGYSLNEIAEKMGYANDSSVRSLLNAESASRMSQAQLTADFLKKQIDEKGMIDVGVGVNRELNISPERLNQALYILELQGYPHYGGGVPQVTNPGKQTNIKVVCPPGTQHKEIYNFDEVHSLKEYTSHDDGKTFDTYKYPESFNSKRLGIRYADEGGLSKDGLIELRRNVPDISLGNSNYSQVRILVDGTHYLKGMAVYSDHMPEGKDIVFNTNKKKGTPALGPKDDTVLKRIKDDPDNPFGSLIKANGQSYYIDSKGKKKMSVINKRADEGDWNDWSDTLPSQFLSKQNRPLIKKQLELAGAGKQEEYDEICSLTNPTVKKALLKSFSDDCDAAAVHLQAAALPRQKYQVLLPVPSMKETEVYAPNYRNGEKVALVRFPHGGLFEIPVLTVNNKHSGARRLMGQNAMDAIGINSKVAERLSGADFDGDCAMVIPTNSRVKISTQPKLRGLEGFDPKLEYSIPRGNPKHVKIMHNTQTEMGKISNLITDMTLKGATSDKLARAVRHSMVVIDAEKHQLDYKLSEAQNGIASLKKEFQGSYDSKGNYHTGASTLISRSKSNIQELKTKGSPKINIKGTKHYNPKLPEGALVYQHVREEYVDKKGVTKVRTQNITKMAATQDARTLSSGTPTEELYASYANHMKALANKARVTMYKTGKIQYDASAKAAYQPEVTSLLNKLNISLKNAPRERQAQVIANAELKAKKQANPDMTSAEAKKVGQQALNNARNAVGAKREKIEITDREWSAIQSGAITENKLYQVINNVDIDALRQRATPRSTTSLGNGKIARIAAMKASGYDNATIAKAVGVSASTVSEYLKKG